MVSVGKVFTKGLTDLEYDGALSYFSYSDTEVFKTLCN